jgi:hypothetical protein
MRLQRPLADWANREIACGKSDLSQIDLKSFEERSRSLNSKGINPPFPSVLNAAVHSLK